jgi:purine-nucleoside phosphorylase
MDVDALRARLGGLTPRVLLTLGSGLASLAEGVADPLVIPFAAVGLPDVTVPGHVGRFVAGTLGGVPVLVQQGRLHLYEGHRAADVTAAVRAAAALGVRTYCVTNAAGGIRYERLTPGDLMLITDHLNLTGTSPGIGVVPPHFVDMAACYDPALGELAQAAAGRLGEPLQAGVYAGLIGPAFETRAEVAMLRTMGADAVGMSTVLEVIAARDAGVRVLGCSVITNVHDLTVDVGKAKTEHAEVLEVGLTAGPRLARILAEALPDLAA